MLFNTALLALVAGAMALPSSGRGSSSSSSNKCYGREYIDTYDNHVATPVLDQDNTIGNTEGGALTYRSFVYSQQNPLVENIPSGNMVALTALATQAESGQPAFFVNSTYKCFDLQSTYYAVTVNDEQSAANVPEAATIQFSGRRACDGKTVVQQLVFNPGLLQVPFNFGFAEFSSDFNCLSRVDVELIQAEISTSSALATVMLDSMKYDAHLADYSCSSCVSSISSS